MELRKLLELVSPLDETAMDAARLRQAQLAKPPGSLGCLEELSIQLAGITGNVYNQFVCAKLSVSSFFFNTDIPPSSFEMRSANHSHSAEGGLSFPRIGVAFLEPRA